MIILLLKKKRQKEKSQEYHKTQTLENCFIQKGG